MTVKATLLAAMLLAVGGALQLEVSAAEAQDYPGHNVSALIKQ